MAEITSPRIFRCETARVYAAAVPGVDPSEEEPLWIQQPYLYVDRLDLLAGPDIDVCQMRYDCGDFALRETDAWGETTPGGWFTPLNLNRKFVKVELIAKSDTGDDDQEQWSVAFTWYGVVKESEEETAQKEFTGENRTGTQRVTAYGLAVLLEDEIIDRSSVLIKSGGFDEIGRGLPFNYSAGSGFERYGNMTRFSSRGVRIFDYFPKTLQDDAVEEDEDEYWNASRAVQYLLNNNAPRGEDDEPLFTWEAEPVTESNLPCAWYDISVETDRRTVKEVIDELLDRRRMMGYWVYGVESGGEFKAKLKVFTFVDEDVDLGDGETIPANPDALDLTTGRSLLVESLRIRSNVAHQADVLRVEGAYINSLITLHVGENAAGVTELVEGWDDADETAYLAGSGGTSEENTAARARDQWRNVFSRFVIDQDWPAKVAYNGEEYFVSIDQTVLPDEVGDELVVSLFDVEAEHNAPWAFHYRPILDYLTLIEFPSKEPRRPFVLFQEASGSYTYAELLNAVEGRSFACNLSLLTETMGIRLEVNQAGGQQLIASDNWAGAAATPEDLDPNDAENLAVSYADMLLTCCVEWDQKLRIEKALGTATGHKRIRVISVPDARLSFEIPGAVTDIDENGAIKESAGRVLRDDRPRMRKIAEAAAVWYGTPRQAAIIPFRDLQPNLVRVGTLVGRLWGTSEDPINTPVTGIAFDFLAGTTTIETSYAELDFSTIQRSVQA